ncbi:phosphopantothenate--cysteine ligase [uncultured Streptococcus sp.]|uniref:phosphopantothenate--cysteine ligase n=1 Tax=uncultured Streptococcus sp. TaxID=83427 RepID=UPI002614A0B3|nr:phosphopantothenate--cysteine ligase [uncultured Streptococcus sp.]
MNILITSGGTSEKIDQVRSITNHSTGQLGKMIAEHCLAEGASVTLLTTAKAVKPDPHEKLTIKIIEDTEQLLTTMEELVAAHDVLIHSMAVSDYKPVYMARFEEVLASSDVTEFLEKSNSESKISSSDDYQVLFLKKNPKIISKVKEWNPNIRLIGFKLLVGVSKEELLAAARASLEKNQAELIVANDLTEISSGQHHAYLLGADTVTEAFSKEEIAEQLLSHIQKGDSS